MDPKQFRQIIKEELAPVKKDIHELRGDMDTLEENFKGIKKDVKELSENVDAARADIEHLHMDVKGIRDTEGLFHSRNKREIDEIKNHLGLPLMPDQP